MGRKRTTVEQIITKLREAEAELAKGSKTPQVCRKLGISEQSQSAAQHQPAQKSDFLLCTPT